MELIGFPDCCGTAIGHHFYNGDSRYPETEASVLKWFAARKKSGYYSQSVMIAITNHHQACVGRAFRKLKGKMIHKYYNRNMSRVNYIWAIPL